MYVLKLLQASGDDRHLVNLVSVAAAGQIVDRRIQTLQNRAVSSVAAQTLSDLVADVASLDRREDEGGFFMISPSFLTKRLQLSTIF